MRYFISKDFYCSDMQGPCHLYMTTNSNARSYFINIQVQSTITADDINLWYEPQIEYHEKTYASNKAKLYKSFKYGYRNYLTYQIDNLDSNTFYQMVLGCKIVDINNKNQFENKNFTALNYNLKVQEPFNLVFKT